LIDVDGTQLGIKSIEEALRIAQNKNTDLVEIAPQNNPPVCKLADFSKFRYEREKKLKEARKKHKGGQVKELRIRPKIGHHDLDIKIEHMREFLKEHDKVRLTIVFRGREMEHKEQANPLVDRVKEKIGDVAVLEQDIPMEGNRKSLLFAPKK
jgi:translation initiation factor IF-3